MFLKKGLKFEIFLVKHDIIYIKYTIFFRNMTNRHTSTSFLPHQLRVMVLSEPRYENGSPYIPQRRHFVGLVTVNVLVIYFGRLQIQVIDNRQEHVEQHKVYDHFEQQKENWTHHRVNFVYSLKVKFTKQNKEQCPH